jgi:shikimate kinase
MSIFLIGYRGSGKSTVGRKLADRLWQPFVDTDDIVVQKAGKTIGEIFAQEGEQRFRDLESEAVREVCQLTEHVISLGGGSLLRQENRDAIKASGGKLVYLKCDAEELAKRIAADPMSNESRPPLTGYGGGVEEIQQLLAVREPIYREMKHAELDVTYLTPDDVVVYVVRLL